MPLPIVLVGVAVTVPSVVGTGASMLKMARDKSRYDRERRQYQRSVDEYRAFVGTVSGGVDALHDQWVAAYGTLLEAADFLERADVRSRTFSPGSKVVPWNVVELKESVDSLRSLAPGIAGGTAGGGALGAVAATGVYAAAGAFGTASTGTAIGSLAGIAARNATLAWLGGGSLATGGAGMAGGVAVLGGIVLAPIAAVPAVISVVKAVRQGRRIESEIQRMDVSKAEMQKHAAELGAVLSRVREMSVSIREVETALEDILRSASAESIEDIYRVACTARTLAQLLDIDGTSRPDSIAAPDGNAGSPVAGPPQPGHGPVNMGVAA